MTNQMTAKGLLRSASVLPTLALAGTIVLAAPAYAQVQPDNGNGTSQNETGPVVQGTSGTTPDVSANGAQTDSPQQEIVVTGSRIPQPNLTSASPITILNEQDVKLQGVTRTEDLVNSLPQAFADQGGGVANGASGTATVNLRNLGPERTLVLVNGRRVMPGDPQSPFADINLIPASLIKRVDVLTGGASSVYGADAVAGVVNFIMDTDFTGFRVDGQYSFFPHSNGARDIVRDALDESGYSYPNGKTADGGTVDATVSFGADFGSDKQGHIVAYAGYRKINAVDESSRDYSSCALDGAGDGFACAGSATSGQGTIFTNDSTYGIGDGTLTDDVALYNYGPRNFYQRNDERYTAGLFADYEVSTAFHPYLEFMFMDDRTTAQIAESGDFGNTLTLNCDNPLLSGQQHGIICAPDNLVLNADGTPQQFFDASGATYTRGNAQILRRNVEGGPRQDDLQHTDFRTVIGARGDIGSGWSYDASYQYGRVNYSETYYNDFSISRLGRALDVVTDPDTGAAVCRSVLDGTDPNCVPYNIFSAGGVTPEATAYLSTPGFQRGRTEEQVATASITGDLGTYGIQSPWAENGVGINVGAEYRKESLTLNTDTAFQTGDLAGQGAATLPVDGSYNVKEVFGELRVPIIEHSFIEEFSVGGGYRYSHYKNGYNSFNTNTYKFEANLAPIRDIAIRGSYNRAVRAPNVQELFAPQRVALDGSDDPCAGDIENGTVNGFTAEQCALTGVTAAQFGNLQPNPSDQYNGLIGGDPTLSPEKATTKTVGVVLQPSFIPNLSITADYFDVKIKNTISTIGADTIINTCLATGDDRFCGLINRDQFGSLWRTPGGYITDLTTNLGSLKTKGVDVSAAYNHRFEGIGSFGVSMAGTWLDKLVTDNGVSEPYDCAGLYGTQCGSPSPEWRHKLRLTYTSPSGIGVSAQWRYISSVKIDASSDNATLTGDYEPVNYKIPSVSYFDLALTANVTDALGLRIGAQNILDKDPPIIGSDAGGNNGLYNGNTYTTYDVLGRYVYVGATVNF